MRYWTGFLGIVAGLTYSGVGCSAAEPFVQDFDGWKITIRPGPSRFADPVPPAPGPAPASHLKLVSHRQEPGPTPERVEPILPAPEPQPDDDGLPRILPGESSQCCDTTTKVNPPEGTVDPRYMSQMYAEMYKSIPFIRAEYDANPSYIHDTTVEFLFGKMRPTVVHRTTNVNYNYGGSPYTPYVYGGYGYGGYAYPPLQLVVPGTGLRIHRLN